ncbi:MAG: hypothetical protein ABIK68_15360 [bacterium]
MQKTRGSMERGLRQLKSAGSKAGMWFKDTKVAHHSQKNIFRIVKEFKKKQKSESISGFFDKLNRAAEDLHRIAKTGYSGLEEKTKRFTFAFIEKGLELLLYEDAARWMLKRANRCLDRSDIVSLDQIRHLSVSDRQKLIDAFYPYDSPGYKKFLQRFNLSFNIGLGAVVATNIPGTGLVVSLVNMGKTLLKIGNRLNIMSAIYGRQIASPKALFKVSASIIRSMEDWENNEAHVPLHANILDTLYQMDAETDSRSFQDLLRSVVRKDAYIAIPGVGMISLGKINLDDLKIDLVVSHLVRNYAETCRLVELYGEETVNHVLHDFVKIYQVFNKHGFFRVVRKKIEKEQPGTEKEKWKTRLKILVGIDKGSDQASKILDQSVKAIFLSTCQQDREDKIAQIEKAVVTVFKNNFKKTH